MLCRHDNGVCIKCISCKKCYRPETIKNSLCGRCLRNQFNITGFYGSKFCERSVDIQDKFGHFEYTIKDPNNSRVAIKVNYELSSSDDEDDDEDDEDYDKSEEDESDDEESEEDESDDDSEDDDSDEDVEMKIKDAQEIETDDDSD